MGCKITHPRRMPVFDPGWSEQSNRDPGEIHLDFRDYESWTVTQGGLRRCISDIEASGKVHNTAT
jgi:hypothetical protein